MGGDVLSGEVLFRGRCCPVGGDVWGRRVVLCRGGSVKGVVVLSIIGSDVITPNPVDRQTGVIALPQTSFAGGKILILI